MIIFSALMILLQLAVGPKLTGTKFEMKIEGVRFIGHPCNLVLSKRDEMLYQRYWSEDCDR